MRDYNNVEVKVFASSKGLQAQDSKDEEQIKALIRNNVLPEVETDYYRVDVKVKRKDNQTPDYLIAYMLRKDSYTADVVEVKIDEHYEFQALNQDYDDSGDEDEDEEDLSYDYAGDFDFVVATPVPEIATAKSAAEYIHRMAIKAGLKSKCLLGNQATVANYKKYLASGLKGFVNIGHGYPGGIVLDDGTLQAGWFSGLQNKALKPAVVYFNSCQVHNDPLKSAVMKAGARTYIGGILSLSIGPSEKVCKCFWTKSLEFTIRCMRETLFTCEADNYHTNNAHGFVGQAGPFKLAAWYNNKSVIRTHAKAGSMYTWALVDNSGWLKLSPSSQDGVTNNFMLLCEARANNKKVDVFVNNAMIDQVTLR